MQFPQMLGSPKELTMPLCAHADTPLQIRCGLPSSGGFKRLRVIILIPLRLPEGLTETEKEAFGCAQDC